MPRRAGLAWGTLILLLAGCSRRDVRATPGETAPPRPIGACEVQPLSEVAPLRASNGEVLFIDNPTIVVNDRSVAIAGNSAIQYRLREHSGVLLPEQASLSKLVGVIRQAGGALEVIPQSTLHVGPSGSPVLHFASDGSLDMLWRSAQVAAGDSIWQLNGGRWSAGRWRNVAPLLTGLKGDVLDQSNTSRTVAVNGQGVSYLLFQRGRRIGARVAAHDGNGWALDSVRTLMLSNPSVLPVSDAESLVLGVTGAEPHGNTIVAFPLAVTPTAAADGYRVSDTTLPYTQKPFGFRQGQELHAIFSGGVSNQENHLFAVTSHDAGRTWQDRVDLRLIGSIGAWDATQDASGRAFVLVYVSNAALASATELQLLMFDANRRAWTTLWRVSDPDIHIFGVPAVVARDGRLHLAFSAELRSAPHSPQTYFLSFELTCRGNAVLGGE